MEQTTFMKSVDIENAVTSQLPEHDLRRDSMELHNGEATSTEDCILPKAPSIASGLIVSSPKEAIELSANANAFEAMPAINQSEHRRSHAQVAEDADWKGIIPGGEAVAPILPAQHAPHTLHYPHENYLYTEEPWYNYTPHADWHSHGTAAYPTEMLQPEPFWYPAPWLDPGFYSQQYYFPSFAPHGQPMSGHSYHSHSSSVMDAASVIKEPSAGPPDHSHVTSRAAPVTEEPCSRDRQHGEQSVEVYLGDTDTFVQMVPLELLLRFSEVAARTFDERYISMHHGQGLGRTLEQPKRLTLDLDSDDLPSKNAVLDAIKWMHCAEHSPEDQLHNVDFPGPKNLDDFDTEDLLDSYQAALVFELQPGTAWMRLAQVLMLRVTERALSFSALKMFHACLPLSDPVFKRAITSVYEHWEQHNYRLNLPFRLSEHYLLYNGGAQLARLARAVAEPFLRRRDERRDERRNVKSGIGRYGNRQYRQAERRRDHEHVKRSPSAPAPARAQDRAETVPIAGRRRDRREQQRCGKEAEAAKGSAMQPRDQS